MLLVVDTVISHERCSEIIVCGTKHLCEPKVDQLYTKEWLVL